MAVSVRDVAVAASVSVGTVSNVLNRPSKVAPATVERVMRAIEDLGFVRNDAARQLRAGRSRSIGLVVLDVGNPFFAEVARGAEARAAEDGMTVLLGNSDERARSRECVPRALPRAAGQRRARHSRRPMTSRCCIACSSGGVPVILVDRELPGSDFGSVAVDDVEGGHLAVSHLTANGRRRIAFVGGPAEDPAGRRPARGRPACRGARVPVHRSRSSRWMRSPFFRGAPRARRSWRAIEPTVRMRCSPPTTCSPSACCRRSRCWPMFVCPATSPHRLRRHRLRGGDGRATELDPAAGAPHRLHAPWICC